MAEIRNEADDVDNNPETNDAEAATAAATTPVRRQNDQRRRNSNDAATACGDLLESRDQTAELRTGGAGQAVGDDAASPSQPSNNQKTGNDADTKVSTDAERQLDWEKIVAEDKAIQRQRYLNEIQRTAIASRVSARRSAQRTPTPTVKVSEDTDDLEKEMSLLSLSETRCAEMDKLRRQRTVRRREERRLPCAADTYQYRTTRSTTRQAAREITVGIDEANDTSSTVKDNAQEEAQKSTSTPPHSEQQQPRSAGEGASNSEIVQEQHTTIGPRNARIRINAPPALRYAVTQLTFNEWVDLVTMNPHMIYYEDDIENSPLVRNVRGQAATSEVTGSTTSTQTTDTNTGQAAEQQQLNEAATRPPMRTPNDATTTTETSRQTTRQTRAVTPMTTPPTDAEDNAHTGTNDVNAHALTRRRNTREFYESVPRDRRNPHGANSRRDAARQQHGNEAPQRRSERDDRAASESSGTTSRRTGASSNIHVPQSGRQGERDNNARQAERRQQRADARQPPHDATQCERDAWNRDVRDWRAVLGYMRYVSAANENGARPASHPRRDVRIPQANVTRAGPAGARASAGIERHCHGRYDIHDVKREVKALSKRFDRMFRGSKPKTNINVFNEPPRRRRRNTSSSDSE